MVKVENKKKRSLLTKHFYEENSRARNIVAVVL